MRWRCMAWCYFCRILFFFSSFIFRPREGYKFAFSAWLNYGAVKRMDGVKGEWRKGGNLGGLGGGVWEVTFYFVHKQFALFQKRRWDEMRLRRSGRERKAGAIDWMVWGLWIIRGRYCALGREVRANWNEINQIKTTWVLFVEWIVMVSWCLSLGEARHGDFEKAVSYQVCQLSAHELSSSFPSNPALTFFLAFRSSPTSLEPSIITHGHVINQ